MAKEGIKHSVRCVCVLPQLAKLKDPPDYHFTVFSVVDQETGEFEDTHVKCDNCGVVHHVTDICRSDVMRGGRDELASVVSIEDVRSAVPSQIANALDHHRCDLPTWQQVAWIIENKRWGSYVVISSEIVDGQKHGKIMTLISENLHKIGAFTIDNTASQEGS